MEVVASSHLFENAIRWKYDTLQLENEQSIFPLPDKVTLLSTLKLSVIQKLSHKSNEMGDFGTQATARPSVKGLTLSTVRLT